LQLGIIRIPKSTHQERIKANADIFNFELSAVDLKVINDLDSNPQRISRDPKNIGF
jgi:diketogulonate reductase-like aldo/keto reductase